MRKAIERRQYSDTVNAYREQTITFHLESKGAHLSVQHGWYHSVLFVSKLGQSSE
jgi:hypothetical protein